MKQVWLSDDYPAFADESLLLPMLQKEFAALTVDITLLARTEDRIVYKISDNFGEKTIVDLVMFSACELRKNV